MAVKIAALTKDEVEELRTLLTAYDKASDKLKSKVDQILEEWESAVDDQKEGWLETDAGQAAIHRLDTLQIFREELLEDTPELNPASLA